jgi:hypothetical protein
MPDSESPAPEAGPDAADAATKDVNVPKKDDYCAKLTPKPKFCDDFDDGDLLNDWDTSAVIPPGMIGLDTSMFTSSPASFGVSTPMLSAGAAGSAAIRKTIFATVNHGTFSFSAFFPNVTLTKGVVSIASFDVSLSHRFTLNLRDSDATAPAASLEEFDNSGYRRHLLTKLPPAGKWTRVAIDLDLAGGKVNLTFDGDKAVDAEPIVATPGTEATVRLGAQYLVGPTDPFEASYDDVIVDF